MFFKILTTEEYHSLENPYRGSQMDKRDGFIHLSLKHQVHITANRFYSSHDTLYLMRIPENQDVIMEPGIMNGREEQELFPHLYGMIDTQKVTIQEYRKQGDFQPIE
jgi:uncharacterized protein (DUF952 family)